MITFEDEIPRVVFKLSSTNVAFRPTYMIPFPILYIVSSDFSEPRVGELNLVYTMSGHMRRSQRAVRVPFLRDPDVFTFCASLHPERCGVHKCCCVQHIFRIVVSGTKGDCL